MRGDDGRQPAADVCGDVDQAAQAGVVAEADRVMQRQHFDRPLAGLFGAARRAASSAKSIAALTFPSAAASQASAMRNCGPNTATWLP
jgi:hypothetical protein